MSRTDQPLVKAEHIVKHFPIRGGVFLRHLQQGGGVAVRKLYGRRAEKRMGALPEKPDLGKLRWKAVLWLL